MNELYLHLHTVNNYGMTFIDTRSERFYAVYLNVASECLKGRVYGLGSLRRKKRRYADPDMSQMPEMVPRAEFDIIADQLRKPSPGLPSAHHRRVACSFRDQALFQLFQICLSSLNQLKTDAMCRLQELALSLGLNCLSFDLVGTSLDESSEEFGTVHVPSAWRLVLEDPSNLQIFFDYYAITKPLISKERNREILFAVREHLSVYPGGGSIKRREYAGHFAIAILLSVEWFYYEPYPYMCRVFPGSSITLSEWIRDWKLQSLLRVSLVSVADMIFWSGVALTLVNVIFGSVVSLYGLFVIMDGSKLGVLRSDLVCGDAFPSADTPSFSLVVGDAITCEGAVGVNRSHGFRNLAGSVVQLLGFAWKSDARDLLTSRSLWRKKRRYVDPDASTSQELAQRGMSNFMILSNGSETELLYSVSDPLPIKDGTETEFMHSVSDPSLISNGSETKFFDSVSVPSLISNGSETKLMHSISVPSLISNGSEKECNYNCTI
ncbi:hypothetical protein Syun_025740 [Stephania yunnanensis]|uniref:Uncharacterized protein n=1 Tax=Stephania yunnanensis TaxID=152371 RepID=A0AAP0ES84_9MAGN